MLKTNTAWIKTKRKGTVSIMRAEQQNTVKDVSRHKFKLCEGLVSIMWERTGLL